MHFNCAMQVQQHSRKMLSRDGTTQPDNPYEELASETSPFLSKDDKSYRPAQDQIQKQGAQQGGQAPALIPSGRPSHYSYALRDLKKVVLVSNDVPAMAWAQNLSSDELHGPLRQYVLPCLPLHMLAHLRATTR